MTIDDEVERVVAAHNKVEAALDVVENAVAAHDATKDVVGHNHYFCATFSFVFQPNTALSQK